MSTRRRLNARDTDDGVYATVWCAFASPPLFFQAAPEKLVFVPCSMDVLLGLVRFDVWMQRGGMYMCHRSLMFLPGYLYLSGKRFFEGTSLGGTAISREFFGRVIV